MSAIHSQTRLKIRVISLLEGGQKAKMIINKNNETLAISLECGELTVKCFIHDSSNTIAASDDKVLVNRNVSHRN